MKIIITKMVQSHGKLRLKIYIILREISLLPKPDEALVNAITLFIVLLCACIVIGHLLEKNRWMTKSITAIAIVSFSTLYAIGHWPATFNYSKCNIHNSI
jgi:hypothetical protein